VNRNVRLEILEAAESVVSDYERAESAKWMKTVQAQRMMDECTSELFGADDEAALGT
jgi:hypothetical protein